MEPDEIIELAIRRIAIRSAPETPVTHGDLIAIADFIWTSTRDSKELDERRHALAAS